jgi:hypothetical protein
LLLSKSKKIFADKNGFALFHKSLAAFGVIGTVEQAADKP